MLAFWHYYSLPPPNSRIFSLRFSLFILYVLRILPTSNTGSLLPFQSAFPAPPPNVSGDCQSALWERWARPWFLLCKDRALRCLRIVTVHIKVRNSKLLTPKSVFSPCLQQVHGRCGRHVQEVVLSLRAQQALLEGPCWSWALVNAKAGLSAELLPTGQMAPLVSVTFHPSQTQWFICLLNPAYQNCCDFWVGESLLSRVVFNALLPQEKSSFHWLLAQLPLAKLGRWLSLLSAHLPFGPTSPPRVGTVLQFPRNSCYLVSGISTLRVATPSNSSHLQCVANKDRIYSHAENWACRQVKLDWEKLRHDSASGIPSCLHKLGTTVRTVRSPSPSWCCASLFPD